MSKGRTSQKFGQNELEARIQDGRRATACTVRCTWGDYADKLFSIAVA